MTNFEHIMENPELVNTLLECGLAVKNGKALNCVTMNNNGEIIKGCPCRECDFVSNKEFCCNERRKWLNAEYKPVPKLTKMEKAFLDAITTKVLYIARDKGGRLYVYDDKPIKLNDCCYSIELAIIFINEDVFGKLFQFIKWDDPEPTSIEWLRTLDVEEGVPDE